MSHEPGEQLSKLSLEEGLQGLQKREGAGEDRPAGPQGQRVVHGAPRGQKLPTHQLKKSEAEPPPPKGRELHEAKSKHLPLLWLQRLAVQSGQFRPHRTGNGLSILVKDAIETPQGRSFEA